MEVNTLASSVISALNSIAYDIRSIFTEIAPVAIGIAGTFLAFRYGMRFFKAISK